MAHSSGGDARWTGGTLVPSTTGFSTCFRFLLTTNWRPLSPRRHSGHAHGCDRQFAKGKTENAHCRVLSADLGKTRYGLDSAITGGSCVLVPSGGRFWMKPTAPSLGARRLTGTGPPLRQRSPRVINHRTTADKKSELKVDACRYVPGNASTRGLEPLPLEA